MKQFLVSENFVSRLESFLDFMKSVFPKVYMTSVACKLHDEINAGLTSHPDWHDVEIEGGPKTNMGEQVLCYDEDGDIFIAEYCGEDGFYRYNGTSYRVYPTHWHKLP